MALRKISSTVGLNSNFHTVGKIQQNNIELTLWDLGGKEGIRNIWPHYYSEAQILLFLLDGVDRNRFIEAKSVFPSLLAEESLKTIPIYFLVNKHDQENCASLGFIKEFFNLEEIGEREINVFHISALTQYFLYREGLDHILSMKL